MQLTCKICNCEIDNYNHFYKIHKISYKKYFDKYLKTKENSTCKICGNGCYFDSGHHCYCKYCSARCRNLDKEWQDKRNTIVFKKYNTLTVQNNEKQYNTWRHKILDRFNAIYKTGYVIDYDFATKKIIAHCNKCNNNFECSYNCLELRLTVYNIEPCTNCLRSKKFNGKSQKELDVLSYIKTFFTENIIDHDHTQLNRLELDFWFPTLSKAIEFDGTYHHADPRFYDKDDIITLKKKTAKEIWEQDKLKDEMCNERNIKLLRIAEYDWDNDNENIKTKIYNFLTE